MAINSNYILLTQIGVYAPQDVPLSYLFSHVGLEIR